MAAMSDWVYRNLRSLQEERNVISKSEKPVQDLREKDILAAMKRLGIQKLELAKETQGQSHNQRPETLDTAFIVEANCLLKQRIVSDAVER